MTDTSSDQAPAPPDPETLERIEEQLGLLIPEARRWRRSRWLAWATAVALVATVALGVTGWVVYQQDRDDDTAQRTVRREALEQALVRECESSADQTADLRTAFNVLIGVAASSADDPAAVERLAMELDARLDEAVPPRDCQQEARNRAGGG